MSDKRAKHSSGKKRLIGAVLLVAACLFIVLAWQSVSTEKYALYRQNLSHYVREMEECEALVHGSFGAEYQYLASEWRTLVDEARGYLTQHRTGALSLTACAALCIISGVYLIASGFGPRRARKEPVQDGAESAAENRTETQG